MANKLITMNKIKQIIRLYTQSKGTKFISRHTGVARNTVKKYIVKFQQTRLTYQDINEMGDQQVSDLFGKPPEAKEPSKRYEQMRAFFPYTDKALRTKGFTREKLWKEYLEKYPDGYRYTQFCICLSKWQKRVNPVMHMVHKAGDKMYVDFAGEKLQIVDTQTGEIQQVEVFVAILGSSQLTYAEACLSQKKEDFITACENALHYFGGVPQAVVPDNLKSAVTKSSKYEPTLNEAFEDFADYYQFTVLPARSYRPRDKALVEGAVKILYNKIYSNLSTEIPASLADLNAAMRPHLEQHNTAAMKGRSYSRRQQFEEIEKKTLQPLPIHRYEFKRQAVVTVMKNGHVCLSDDKHYYSVPFKYISKKVKLIYSKTSVEIYFKYERIALHQRIKSPFNYTTVEEHMASTHRFVSEWSAEKFISWAESIHPDVRLFIERILEKKQHPEQAYKSCVGVLSFAKKVGKERLINACKRALDYGYYNYKIIQTILEKGLDNEIESSEENTQLEMPLHDNIRGENYYE
ncbi:MAG: IS21 family transposase [Bacteroidetes bacterium]|nr:MAG: IS21 family transposase [Bacteroidota bacterium]